MPVHIRVLTGCGKNDWGGSRKTAPRDRRPHINSAGPLTPDGKVGIDPMENGEGRVRNLFQKLGVLAVQLGHALRRQAR